MVRSEEESMSHRIHHPDGRWQATLEKKYGGIRPKKKPLISKGSGRVFFDSADWALCQQGEDTRAAVETLRPKLQPTPHQRLPPRRPACRSVRDDKVMKHRIVNFSFYMDVVNTRTPIKQFYMP
ncbi:unnamed protein product [Spirodela intermedia]|uniref:Uncharacterized protein n=1 Tax=Spirodela intermedia TaxID=51605 RepID=A0A7I8KLN2_SPIIN|nr:unnamed protein product [Spirodela intermedia]